MSWSEIYRDEHWDRGPGVTMRIDTAKYDWLVKLYVGRAHRGEVALPDCNESDARTWAQSACRRPITGSVLLRRGGGDGSVMRFGESAKETW